LAIGTLPTRYTLRGMIFPRSRATVTAARR
jgi:hypothetical protein